MAEREREIREATRARHRAERDMALQRARIEHEIDKQRATGGMPW